MFGQYLFPKVRSSERLGTPKGLAHSTSWSLCASPIRRRAASSLVLQSPRSRAAPYSEPRTFTKLSGAISSEVLAGPDLRIGTSTMPLTDCHVPFFQPH